MDNQRNNIIKRDMVRMVRILEVPLLLLVVSFECFEEGSTIMGIILLIVSMTRMWANVTTDEFIYKK
jgi:hypothetical protein